WNPLPGFGNAEVCITEALVYTVDQNNMVSLKMHKKYC
ncbi:hypothetical protein CEXT_746561, partial [Caerostris extrusa]